TADYPRQYGGGLLAVRSTRAHACVSTHEHLPMPKFFDTVGNALPGLAQVCLRVGIGKAQIAFTLHTPNEAGKRSNATGLEEMIGQFLGRAADLRDIWKGVEGAAGHSATDTWNRVQALDKDVSPPPKLRHHGLHRLLRAGEGRQRRPLRERGGA